MVKRSPKHHKNWGDKEQELLREKRIKYHVARSTAKRLGISWSTGFEEINWVDTCPVLSIPINYLSEGRTDNSCAIDRYDKSGGYTPDNTFVCSWRAKRLRSDGLDYEHTNIGKFFEYHLS